MGVSVWAEVWLLRLPRSSGDRPYDVHKYGYSPTYESNGFPNGSVYSPHSAPM